MNHAQIVFKPLKEANHVIDISGYDYAQLLKEATRYVICHEIGTQKERPHTHIYLETADCEKTIRNKILKYLRIPKTTRGKASAFYGLFFNKYKDPSPSYIVKEGNIHDSHGYTEEQLQHYITQGAFRYLKTFDTDLTQETEVVAAERATTEVVATTEFEKLKRAVSQRADVAQMTMAQIKTWIWSYYLKQGKCIPRDGDTRRYAISIWAIVRNNVGYDDGGARKTVFEASLI